MVQHRARLPLRQQHAGHDLPVATKPGNQHRCVLWLRNFLHRRSTAVRIAWQQPFVHRDQQQRAHQHRHRHRTDQQRCSLGREDVGTGGSLKHDKGEFATLCQQHSEHGTLLKGQLQLSGQKVDHQCLDRQKTQDDTRHLPWELGQHAQVNPHPYRDEEEPEQQPFERFDIGFQLAPVLTFRQQHTRQEGAQRHRQTHPLHQRRNAHHQQQRRSGEDFRCPAARNPAEQGSQQQAPAQHDTSDNR